MPVTRQFCIAVVVVNLQSSLFLIVVGVSFFFSLWFNDAPSNTSAVFTTAACSFISPPLPLFCLFFWPDSFPYSQLALISPADDPSFFVILFFVFSESASVRSFYISVPLS